MDLGTAASLAGLVVSLVISGYQHHKTKLAREETRRERERAATLEDHLERQRWQQLRSIGEQIDAIEHDGRQTYSAHDAALHARLKEQFATLLGMIVTSNKCSPGLLRQWVRTGRLRRPWQIAEAMTHVDMRAPEASPDDVKWLEDLLNGGTVVSAPRALPAPPELPPLVAAYVLLLDAVGPEIKSLLPVGGQTAYSVTCLLYFLARDCVELATNTHGRKTLTAWGNETLKSFRDRFSFYESQYFWLVALAADSVRKELEEYSNLFESTTQYLIPKANSVQQALIKYPEIHRAISGLWATPTGKVIQASG